MQSRNGETQKILEDIDKKLNQIISYLHFQNFHELKERIKQLLDSDEKRIVYQNCNGEIGINEIARITCINAMNISNWVRKFESEGIIFTQTYKNKKCPLKIVDLEDIGIRTPSAQKEIPTKEVVNETDKGDKIE